MVLRGRMGAVSMQRAKTKDLDAAPGPLTSQLQFKDLKLGRIIGAGQFGLVRIVQHNTTGEAYALKVGAPPRMISDLGAQNCLKLSF